MNTFLLIALIAFWVSSILLLYKWKYFRRFVLINILIAAMYLAYLSLAKLPFLGQDTMGLGRFVLILLVIAGHTCAAFIFAVIRHFLLRRDPPMQPTV